jgi:ribosomal protein S27AE
VEQAFTWLDGNALAGLLYEVFAADMTRALRRCQSCGTRSALGAHRAYRGAGTVLRCPVCGDVGLRVASLPDRYIVRFAGEWTIELPSA